MSSQRLSHDIDSKQSEKILDLLKQQTNIFKGFSKQDMAEISQVLKLVQFRKNQKICMVQEPVDMFGIVLYGDLRIGEDNKDAHFLKIGDMFGQ